MVYSNNLPLNHDTAARPALQERRLIAAANEQRLFLHRLMALPGEVAANATVEASPLAGAATAPACTGMNAARPVIVIVAVILTTAATAFLLVTPAATARMLLLAAFLPARVPLIHCEVELAVGARRRQPVILGLSFLRRAQPPTGVLPR